MAFDVLIQMTDADGNVIRVSDQYRQLTHLWEGCLVSMDAPSYMPDTVHGGYVRPNFGGLSIAPNAFPAWPPARVYEIEILSTESTEEAAEIIYQGTAYMTAFSRTDAVFSLYSPENNHYVLGEITDYDGDTVLCPRAFGQVNFESPVRVADVSGLSTFHKSYITGSLTLKITGIADNGSGIAQITTAAAHGFLTGQEVTIEGQILYNGRFTVTNPGTTTFDLTGKAYTAEAAAGHVFTDSMCRVYDGPVPIPDLVSDNGDGTFSLSAAVNSLLVSGTGDKISLFDIFTYYAGIMALTLNTAYAENVNLSFWQEQQEQVLDFLSAMAASAAHIFYIKSGVLYLIDMETAVTTYTLTEIDFIRASYSYAAPCSGCRASWTNAEMVNSDPNSSTAVNEIEFQGLEGSTHTFGDVYDVRTFSRNKTVISAQLEKILELKTSVQIMLEMPDEIVPDIGDRLIFSDSSQHQTIGPLQLNVRGLQVDPLNSRLTVLGEPAVADTPVSDNLIVNGDFSGGTYSTTYFGTVPNSWTYKAEDAGYYTSIRTTTRPTNVELSGDNYFLSLWGRSYAVTERLIQKISIENGKYYELKFDLCHVSGTNRPSIQIMAGSFPLNSSQAWGVQSPLYLDATISDNENEWLSYTFVFQAGFTSETHPEVIIALGTEEGLTTESLFYIDNIDLRQIEPPPDWI